MPARKRRGLIEIELGDGNPRDRVAGFRLLHLLPGIGSATAQRVLDRMAESLVTPGR
jgi:hypothetical protein